MFCIVLTGCRLYGVTVTQTFYYYRSSKASTDAWHTKFLVRGLASQSPTRAKQRIQVLVLM